MPPLIVYVADPFKREDAIARTGLVGANVVAEVRRVFPEATGIDLVVTRRGKKLRGDETLADDDVIEVLARPAWAAIVASPFWSAVVASLIGAAISFLVAYLTRPKNKNKNASPSYNINFDQNVPRLGDTIPVIYGNVLATPDVASQPYSEFVSHKERASMILCLGMGEYQINDILVGETRVADYPPGNVTTWIFPPSLHGNRFGIIEQITGVCENMITLPESTGVDLASPNDPPEVSVGATVSGGVLLPNNPQETALWNGLVPGKKYVISNSNGGKVVATYIGLGANNSAVFDQALPAPGPWVGIDLIAQLSPITDAQEGPMMLLYSQNKELPSVAIGEIIYVQNAAGKRFGPYEVARSEIRWTRLYLRLSGLGFESQTGQEGIYPAQWVSIVRNLYVTYYVSEYVEGVNINEAYRWRGWFASCRPGSTVDTIYVDLTAPQGMAWITDKGDYKSITSTVAIDIQQIDDDGNAIGGVSRKIANISGATSTPRALSFKYPVARGRYRIRAARINDRDQRASKELSATVLSAIRCRIADFAYGQRCYEAATIIVMQFVASAGLSAAANRRVKVDATRKVIGPDGSLIASTNPADAVRDAYTDTLYGGGRPLSELDTATLYRLRPQWGTVNGFNAIFDQPTTLIEALQAITNPVRAMPLPVGRSMSFAQDCPRSKSYVFGPDTIVKGTLQVAYNFAGVDEPDCVEVTYTDPYSWADARVYYPSEGVKPERMELFGCTDKNHALSWGRLAWQERQQAKKSIRFDLEGEGYLLNPLTRFGVIIPVVDYSTAGQVVSLDPSGRVTLDNPLPLGVDTIYFRNALGEIDGPYACAFPEAGKRWIVVVGSGLPPNVYAPSNEVEGSRWMAGLGQAFDFRVTDLQSGENMRINVDGTEYRDSIYSGTFVQYWSA